MAATVDRDGPSRNWKRLDLDHLDRKLAILGLYRNASDLAIICRQCKYALKPSAGAVSKHLWEKHQISKDARKGLALSSSLSRSPSQAFVFSSNLGVSVAATPITQLSGGRKSKIIVTYEDKTISSTLEQPNG